MSTTVARLEAILSADTGQFDRAMDKSHATMGKTQKIAGAAGAAIAVGLGLAARAGFKEMLEGEKATAQTNAVLKSTAGIANVTAKEIDRMANSLLRKSGVDDEQIKAGENMLLTFTKIRNEVGAGNDIFNQATAATLNLSVAMGKDMQSSAILVGKALNDPIKGMTALSRAGIQFSEDQKTMIASMISAGDQMGAQKIILKELETQFGGSAAAAGQTMAGQMNVAKESFKNLTAQLIVGVMPAVNALIGAMISATNWMSENQKATKILIGGLAALAVVLGTVAVATRVFAAAQVIARAATVAWTAAQWLLNVAVSANPYVAVGIALVALSAALVIAYRRSETFRKIVSEAMNAVKIAAEIALAPIISLLHSFLSVVNAAVSAVHALSSAISSIPTPHIPSVGGILSHIPGRAAGGPVSAGRAYMVGERGPELFVPPLSGNIIAHAAIKGGVGSAAAKSVQERSLAFFRSVWPFAQQFLGTSAEMPNTYFPIPGVSDFGSFIGMTQAEPVGKRTMIWPEWFSSLFLLGSNPSRKSSAFSTLIHEWAHAFQDRGRTGTHTLLEGGAEAFSRYVSPLIAKQMGFDWFSPQGSGTYQSLYESVMKNQGMDWVLNGQFGRGGTFGGVKTGFAHASIAKAGGGTAPLSWQEKSLAMFRSVWELVQPYLGARATMPGTYFPMTGSGDDLFVGMSMDENVGKRKMIWPQWFASWLLGGNVMNKSAAFATLIHEWAHAFQDQGQTSTFQTSEGGATAFSRYLSPLIASRMGFKWFTNPPLAGDPYTPAFNWVMKNKGLDWVMDGQFGRKGTFGGIPVGVFDQGGWLKPGLTLAYNGTGAPERVGGGDQHFHLYNHGVLGSEREVIGWLKSAFKRDERRGG